MGLEISLATAFLLVALPLVIDTAFFFVPGNVGTFEAGHAYLFLLLSMDPAAGLSAALVKRFRKLFWLAVGVILLYTHIAFEGLEGQRYKKSEVHLTAV